MKDYQKTDKKRNRHILKLRKNGAPLDMIGLKYGISKERVSQICKKMEKKLSTNQVLDK